MAAIDTTLIFIYLAAMIAIGLYANSKQKDVDDYYVAGRRQGSFSIACLWLASWIGGASIIGSSAKAYEAGITGIWYVGAVAVGCVLYGLTFATRVKRLGDIHHHLTYPDLIESHYDSRTRIVATITTSMAFIAFAAGQLAAAGSILHVLLGWDFGTSLLLASGIVIVYTATGGYLAVAWTDWVQFALLLMGVLLIGLPIAIQNHGSPSELVQTLPHSYFDIGAWGWSAIIALGVSITLSFFTGMDSYTRTFAARSPQAARNGALLAAAFVLPLAIAATWMGLTTAVLFPGIADSNDALTTFVVELFPNGLKGLMLIGILAAIMSTADICILTVSANVTRDVYQRYFEPDMAQKRLLRLSSASTLFAGLLAAFLAWKMQDVLEILSLAFTLNSAALILPTIAAVYGWRTDSTSAFWSICLSLATVISWYLGAAFKLSPVFTFAPLWPGLVVAFFSFFLLSLRARQASPGDYSV